MLTSFVYKPAFTYAYHLTPLTDEEMATVTVLIGERREIKILVEAAEVDRAVVVAEVVVASMDRAVVVEDTTVLVVEAVTDIEILPHLKSPELPAAALPKS